MVKGNRNINVKTEDIGTEGRNINDKIDDKGTEGRSARGRSLISK